MSELNTIALALVVVALVQAVFIWVRHYQMSWLGERVVADLRVAVFRKLLTLPPGWFHQRHTGEIMSRLSSDVTLIDNLVGTELSLALRHGLTLIGGVVMLVVTNPKLAATVLAVVPPASVLDDGELPPHAATTVAPSTSAASTPLTRTGRTLFMSPPDGRLRRLLHDVQEAGQEGPGDAGAGHASGRRETRRPGSGERARTPINGTKTRCPTIERPRTDPEEDTQWAGLPTPSGVGCAPPGPVGFVVL